MDEVTNTFHDSRTTMTLAYRTRTGRAHVGVAECPAYRVSPGRPWVDLKPWTEGTTGARAGRLKSWAKHWKRSGLVMVDV
jgi:hypothetical protein